jgi:hypothetical protein
LHKALHNYGSLFLGEETTVMYGDKCACSGAEFFCFFDVEEALSAALLTSSVLMCEANDLRVLKLDTPRHLAAEPFWYIIPLTFTILNAGT